jgi:hypothetical protein
MDMLLKTDEYEEIVATLKACKKFLIETDTDSTYWKWVFISLHNALQGCMVIALTRADGFGAINKQQEKEWREAYAKNGELPKQEEQLLRFLDLYKKIKKRGTLQYTSLEKFYPQGNQGWSINKLDNLRNEFIHFTPKGWSLELTGASDICIDCIDIAKTLVMRCGKFSSFLSYNENELVDLLEDLRSNFDERKIAQPVAGGEEVTPLAEARIEPQL